jgi:hypothetical protein
MLFIDGRFFHKSGYLLGSTHADDVLMCTLGRVVARMAAVKPHGWVHASLERVRMGTSFPNWSERDNQIHKYSSGMNSDVRI